MPSGVINQNYIIMKLKFTLLLLLAFCIGTAINAQDPVEKIIEPDVGFLPPHHLVYDLVSRFLAAVCHAAAVIVEQDTVRKILAHYAERVATVMVDVFEQAAALRGPIG